MKPYKVGFVAGVFDLFHVGHLNLLRGAKEQCEYLIAGVVADEICIHAKGQTPHIPVEERREILEACRYVDRAVVLYHPEQRKKHSWERYRYDCFFSGDDWKDSPAWQAEGEWLRSVGSDLVFLPYTKGRTSTQLRKAIAGEAPPSQYKP